MTPASQRIWPCWKRFSLRETRRDSVFNSRGNGKMIDLLREHGANPRSLNNSGKSPLELSRVIGNYDVAQFFEDLD